MPITLIEAEKGDVVYYELPHYWSLRNLAKRYLAAMTRTLDAFEQVVGRDSRHWKTLNTKRHSLRDYLQTALQRGVVGQVGDRGKIMRDVNKKIKELSLRGTDSFYKYQRKFLNSCFNLLNTEANRLAGDIANSHRRYDQRLLNLINIAKNHVIQLKTFLAQNDAGSETFDFLGFWAILMRLQGNLKDLSFAFTTVWKKNALETYLNVTLLNPEQYQRRVRAPTEAYRRLSGLRAPAAPIPGPVVFAEPVVPEPEILVPEVEELINPEMVLPPRVRRNEELLGARRRTPLVAPGQSHRGEEEFGGARRRTPLGTPGPSHRGEEEFGGGARRRTPLVAAGPSHRRVEGLLGVRLRASGGPREDQPEGANARPERANARPSRRTRRPHVPLYLATEEDEEEDEEEEAGSPPQYIRVQELLGKRKRPEEATRQNRLIRFPASPLASMIFTDVSDLSSNELTSEYAGVPTVIGRPRS